MKKITLSLFITGLLCVSAVISNAQNTWTQKASFGGVPRWGASEFVIGHYGFVGCGQTSTGYANDFWKWNQITNTWTQIANYPGAGSFTCTSCTINGKGYVGLGGSSSSCCSNDWWSYDTVNGWKQMANFPGTPRHGGVVFVLGNNAYVGTGDPGGTPYLQDMWKYDALNNNWSSISAYTGGKVSSPIAFTIGNYGYIGGGNEGSNLFKPFVQYDTVTNSWAFIDSLPIAGTGIEGASSFVINGTGYFGSGLNESGNDLREFWAYDTSTKTWSSISNLLGVSRWLAIGFSLGNKGYVCTGIDSNNNYLSDLWEYAPANTTGIPSLSNLGTQLRISPNPAQNQINIQLSGNNNLWSVELYSVTGQKVLEQKPSTQYTILNTTEIPNGIYFLKVKMGDGSTLVKKVEIIK